TSRKSILERNNKNERSKPVVYKRENNLTKEEVKEKLINESKKIKKENIKKLLNKVIEKKINKYYINEKLNKLINEKVKKYNTIKSQKVPLFKSGKFAGKSYLDVMQNDESRNYILNSNSIGYGKFKQFYNQNKNYYNSEEKEEKKQERININNIVEENNAYEIRLINKKENNHFN
ncbi:hypothetical protein, partial [Ferroplasma sp.]|uniref:hypothetical protein n=1 Tax=Ferroplasma sp. TaxID=2591003 RepID=UPI00262B64CB